MIFNKKKEKEEGAVAEKSAVDAAVGKPVIDVVEYVDHIVRGLVAKPDSVKIERVEVESMVVIGVTVAKDDVGRVIGKEGRIAESIRILLSAVTRNSGMKMHALEISDPRKERGSSKY